MIARIFKNRSKNNSSKKTQNHPNIPNIGIYWLGHENFLKYL